MKQRKTYSRDTGNFLAKLKAVGDVSKGAILVTADVVGSLNIVVGWSKYYFDFKTYKF